MADAVPRPVKLRVGKRIERLQSLVESQADATAHSARLAVWSRSDKIGPVREIAIRSRLLVTTRDHPDVSRLQELSSSKSAALHVLLLALFEVQVRSPRSGRESPARTRLPIRYSENPSRPSWVEFTALPTVEATRSRTHARTGTDNRERQIKRALDRLAAFGRVELKPERTHGRYERFLLLNEGVNNGDGAGTTYYKRPPVGTGRKRRLVTYVPAEFYLNGWIDALTDSEIITYLTLRFMAQAHPRRHAEGGVFLSQELRKNRFGLDRTFEAHRMLGRYGLIHTTRDSRRNANGTLQGFDDDGDTGYLHRFQLVDEMLLQPAIPRVITSLSRFVAGMDVDQAVLADTAADWGSQLTS